MSGHPRTVHLELMLMPKSCQGIRDEHSFVHSVVNFKTLLKSSHPLPQDLVKETVEEQGGQYTALSDTS